MFPKWWCEPDWRKLFLLILYIIQWLLLTAHLALLKEMNRSGVGKKKGIWMVFLCQFIFTTFKSYALIFCCKNIGREIRGWSQETAKIERKRTDQEGSGVKIDKGICEGYYLLGVGQSESQLGYQETPPPTPRAFSNLQWANGFFPAEGGSRLCKLPQVLLKYISWKILEHVFIRQV